MKAWCHYIRFALMLNVIGVYGSVCNSREFVHPLSTNCEYCRGFVAEDMFGRNVCTECPEGTHIFASQPRSILDCKKSPCGGNEYMSDSRCKYCMGYVVSNSSQHTSCVQCPAGSFGNMNVARTSINDCIESDSECEVYEFKSDFGCEYCFGYATMDSSNRSQCNQCPDGTQIHKNWLRPTSLLDCACANEIQEVRSGGTITCSECDTIDTRISVDKTKCVPCVDDGTTDARCTCGAGKDGLNGRPCEACRGNFYKNELSRIGCIPCEYGKYANIEKTGCEWCPFGKTTSTIDGECIFPLSCPTVLFNTSLPIIDGYEYFSSYRDERMNFEYMRDQVLDDSIVSRRVERCAQKCDLTPYCMTFHVEISAKHGNASNFYDRNGYDTWWECRISRKQSWQQTHEALGVMYSGGSDVLALSHWTFRKCNVMAECRPGFTRDLEQIRCAPCSENTFKPTFGDDACEECATGKSNFARGVANKSDCIDQYENCSYAIFNTSLPQTRDFEYYSSVIWSGMQDRVLAESEYTPENISTAAYLQKRFENCVQKCRSTSSCLFFSIETAPYSNFSSAASPGSFVCRYVKDYSIRNAAQIVTDFGEMYAGGSNVLALGYWTYKKCAEICGPGFTWSPDQLICRPCQEHTYKSVTGNHACTACPAGKFMHTKGSANESDCRCPSATVSGINGSCVECPAGKTNQHPGSDDFCTDCPVNTYSSVVGMHGDCFACPPNSQSPNKGNKIPQECTCNAGHAKYDATSHTCYECLPGTFNDGALNKSDITCDNCAAGKYSTVHGSTSEDNCSLCPSFSDNRREGTSTETFCRCIAGYSGVNSNCQPCRIGTFKPEWGDQLCENCPAGKHSPNYGASVCRDCPAGKYKTTQGDDECQACPLHSLGPSGSTTRMSCFCKSSRSGQNGGECHMCAAGLYSRLVLNATICDQLCARKFDAASITAAYESNTQYLPCIEFVV